MAYDGFVVADIVKEITDKAKGGRISKVQQPEKDEIHFVIKKERMTSRLLMSANPSLPLCYFTEFTKESPMTAPAFCMLLRKHLGGGRITDVTQKGNERIIELIVEHSDEMGDLAEKRLIVEIMGRYSNIILVDSDGIIMDSIKRISHDKSSVREVLPGRVYEYPPGKASPFETDFEGFKETLSLLPMGTAKAVVESYNGFSFTMANEICFRAGIDAGSPTAALSEAEYGALYREYEGILVSTRNGCFFPTLCYEDKEPVEYAAFKLTSYGDKAVSGKEDGSQGSGQEMSGSGENTAAGYISGIIEKFYREKEINVRARQKSHDLRKILTNAIERVSKKYDLQLNQLRSTGDRDKYRIYGELVNAYGYTVPEGSAELVCTNYYDGQEVKIRLDPELSVSKNAQRYFDRYNKKKRTYEALTVETEETRKALEYLQQIKQDLDIAETENDINSVRQELIIAGEIKKKDPKTKTKKQAKEKPMHFISSCGYDIYVGRNNLQNDELSFKIADGGDMWFHAKNMPGSHVIVKCAGKGELPDRVYEEAARLAAYYSSGKESPKVEVDYTERKNLKKPPGANPGYVIYHTNYSMVAPPDINGIKRQEE